MSDCAHLFALTDVSSWRPAESFVFDDGEELLSGRVLEERHELYTCKRCGHQAALTHEKPVDSARWGDGGHSMVNR